MSKTTISAEIIADSRNEHGQRLITYALTFPVAKYYDFQSITKQTPAPKDRPPFKNYRKVYNERDKLMDYRNQLLQELDLVSDWIQQCYDIDKIINP